MTTLPTLIDRVRSLKGADREVDAMVWVAVHGGYIKHNGYQGASSRRIMWCDDIGDGMVRARRSLGTVEAAPKLTASVDAVLGLIAEKLPGQQGVLMQDAENDLAVSGYTDGPEYTGQLARFLLLAFLNALDPGDHP